MSAGEIAEFKSRVTKDCEEMRHKWAMSWAEISKYLEDENMEGKTEFRLVVGDKGKCYIHPIGKDGNTLDFEL